MSSSRNKKSGTGSSSRSSTKSSTKSSGKSKSTTKTDSSEEWTDWAPDPSLPTVREYRVRETDGDWEYEYRYYDEIKTPRYSDSRGGAGLQAVNEELEIESRQPFIPVEDRHSASPTGFGTNYTTTGADASHEADSAILPLTQDLARTRLESSLSQTNIPSHGTLPSSMADDENTSTMPRDPRNTLPYSYQMPKSNAQLPYPSSSFPSGQSNPQYSQFMQPSPSPWATSNQRTAGPAPSSTGSERNFSGEAQQEAQQVVGSPKNKELRQGYKLHNSREFKLLRIFKIVWTEPMGHRMPGNSRWTDDEVQKTLYGEEYYTSVRRFVIVETHEGHCCCLPILTYRRQGTSKPGVKPQDHAIIYTEDKNNKGEKPTEAPGEEKLYNVPIRMNPRTPRDQLDPLSRLNYAKVYTIEYNVKVCFIGEIAEDSKDDFGRSYNQKRLPLPEGDNEEFEVDAGEQFEQ